MLKHYGLWNNKINKWMLTGGGEIIWSSNKAVIEAYYDMQRSEDREYLEIKEFIEKTGE